MIRNIVFDISNVLAPFRFKEFLAEKGKLTYEEAIEAFLSVDPDIRNELHKAYDSCSGIMGRYDYTEENVLSAEELGFTGIVFTGYEDAVSKLEKY